MYDIITIGAATRDVFLLSDKFTFIHSREFETGIGECVSFGTKLEVDKVVFTTGGGATNAAATFANLGYDTAVWCRVGNDAAGHEIHNDLRVYKIKTALVQKVKNGASAYSTLLTAANGERTALVLRGVSSAFSEKEISWGKLKTHVIYLTSLGGNLVLSKKIIEKQKTAGNFVAWNPGKSELLKGLKNFRSILPKVDVLIINHEEAELLTSKKDLKEMFKLLARSNGVTIITDGAKGAYAEKENKIFVATTTGVRSVSRTGAGDSFGSGVVAGLLKYDDLKKALAVGMINAEAVIQKIGAKAGLLKTWPSEKQMSKIKISLLK
ncbi:MAG: carbohydrate kinase family protein [Candidatus Uhrbacteria bacterium]